ncbi:MAG: class I SAM-dependent methyltransferase [Alphaproteobacteria bacterium]|nr:class I SAM-dependent methyltransferase [Alphaproteobacteria bacterium]
MIRLSSTRRPALGALYDAISDRWQAGLDRLGYPAAYAELFRAGPAQAPGRMLDLGTGSGAFAMAALQRCGPADRVVLLDISDRMLGEAARRLAATGVTVETLAAPVGSDALAPEVFDTVLAAHVIEHLDDVPAALAWCRRRLVSGGHFYLCVSRPHWCTALLRWKWGHRAYAPDRMMALLAGAGFRDIRHVAFSSGPPSRTSAGYIATAP